ncbi:MAG: type I glyceraldehyde-3-phosphate dehydrogenase, partial [Deltaproteobacteria bacterium]|nr:type I glyceraldehyde-3-phosphate dehydrogenase [Deltaproteobacteria bacterium]
MTVRIGINGFGRIGRCVMRAARGRDVEIVGINDLGDRETLVHLLQHDSTHGSFEGDVALEGDDLLLDGRSIPIYAERDPAGLPWGDLGVQVAIESTSHFSDRPGASKHLEAGAERVLISAPAKDPDVTLVLGVNDDAYEPGAHRILSMASCTTNCLAPVAQVLDQRFGLERGWMTTVHAYTNDQNTLDGPHSDLRRARAAALSMIPTSTGAAKAVGLVLPQLQGKLDGYAIRVPTADVSAVDLSVELSCDTDAEAINDAMRQAAGGPMKGILQVCDEPLVSIDFQHNSHSSIVDAGLTRVMDGNFAKVVSWYDNEWGYA